MTDYSELIYYLTNPEISDKKSYITLAAEAITELKNENERLYQSYCYVLSLCHIFASCQTCIHGTGPKHKNCKIGGCNTNTEADMWELDTHLWEDRLNDKI